MILRYQIITVCIFICIYDKTFQPLGAFLWEMQGTASLNTLQDTNWGTVGPS